VTTLAECLKVLTIVRASSSERGDVVDFSSRFVTAATEGFLSKDVRSELSPFVSIVPVG